MDKFKVGDRVICVAPHPEGVRGMRGRKGTVTAPRQKRLCSDFRSRLGYRVRFDGENKSLITLEWELLPDSPESEKEVKRREEITA